MKVVRKMRGSVNQNNSIALQKDNINLSLETYKSSKKSNNFCFVGNLEEKIDGRYA